MCNHNFYYLQHLAAFYGRLNMLKMFVRCNGDLTLRNQNLGTPFMCAANGGWIECTRFLANIPHTDLEATNLHGATALHGASEDGHVDVVEYLISVGCNIHARNKHKGTPLLLAAEKGHLDIVKALVEAGADVNAIDKHDTTALVYAVWHRFLPVVQYLLEAGTDHSIRTTQEYTALSLAVLCDWEPGVRALIDAGADATVPGPEGTTMLEAAVSAANNNIFGMLLAAGADPMVRFSTALLPCEDPDVRKSESFMTALAEWGGIADGTAFQDVLQWAPDADALCANVYTAFQRRAWRVRRDAIRLYAAVYCDANGVHPSQCL
jgi:ankyrin repeat protein